ESYMNIPAIMSAALLSGAQAIHPGYGFLSENADFAEVCKDHGLVFIGPPPEVLRLFHDKAQTRVDMKRAGTPVSPGSDGPGRGICLGESECSIQRRNQKMIEEAPSASISESLRQDIAKLAVDAAVRSGYRNVGTFEFLVDAQNKTYFIEVNSRIQVEHTVTEMTTGMDLVKEQIALASGELLSFS